MGLKNIIKLLTNYVTHFEKKHFVVYAVLRFMDCYYTDSPLFARRPDAFCIRNTEFVVARWP